MVDAATLTSPAQAGRGDADPENSGGKNLARLLNRAMATAGTKVRPAQMSLFGPSRTQLRHRALSQKCHTRTSQGGHLINWSGRARSDVETCETLKLFRTGKFLSA